MNNAYVEGPLAAGGDTTRLDVTLRLTGSQAPLATSFGHKVGVALKSWEDVSPKYINIWIRLEATLRFTGSQSPLAAFFRHTEGVALNIVGDASNNV